jgi:hypothetical protein
MIRSRRWTDPKPPEVKRAAKKRRMMRAKEPARATQAEVRMQANGSACPDHNLAHMKFGRVTVNPNSSVKSFKLKRRSFAGTLPTSTWKRITQQNVGSRTIAN